MIILAYSNLDCLIAGIRFHWWDHFLDLILSVFEIFKIERLRFGIVSKLLDNFRKTLWGYGLSSDGFRFLFWLRDRFFVLTNLLFDLTHYLRMLFLNFFLNRIPLFIIGFYCRCKLCNRIFSFIVLNSIDCLVAFSIIWFLLFLTRLLLLLSGVSHSFLLLWSGSNFSLIRFFRSLLCSLLMNSILLFWLLLWQNLILNLICLNLTIHFSHSGFSGIFNRCHFIRNGWVNWLCWQHRRLFSFLGVNILRRYLSNGFIINRCHFIWNWWNHLLYWQLLSWCRNLSL